MSEQNELMNTADIEMLENVLVNGDLAKLSAPQRLDYYRQVCQSMGLNPLSRPFDYINLNGKLTLYAKKDATDQLRKIHQVSIDDIDIQEDKESFTVKVKGHDADGRSDVEIGCVAKTDMRGNAQNTKMKAVTKAKRRLTLSLCGLGWLDETEVESIQDAKPVIVDSATGEILKSAPQIEQPKKEFNEEEFLRQWTKPGYVPGMARESAETMMDEQGQPYGEKSTRTLFNMLRVITKKIDSATPEQKEQYALKVSAICEILQNRKLALTIKDDDNPFIGQK